MPRKRRTPLPAPPGTLPPAPPLKFSPEAQALYDRIASGWKLTAPVEALLRLTCECLTKANQCEHITAVEGMHIADGKGAAKPHPMALLSRDYRSQAGTCLQRLLAHIENH